MVKSVSPTEAHLTIRSARASPFPCFGDAECGSVQKTTPRVWGCFTISGATLSPADANIPEVRFFEAGRVPGEKYRFAVIAARMDGKWVLVRHRKRTTWEIPGGHREPGEEVNETAQRELVEETGATRFTVTPVCDYSVTLRGEETFGRLFFAEILEMGPLPDLEIGETRLYDSLPENLTYPDIQPHLVRYVSECFIQLRTSS